MPFVDKTMGNRITKKTIDIFDNVEDPRQLEYMAVMLVDERCKYDPEKIAKYAIQKGHASRLGYLANLALESAKELNVGDRKRTEKLLRLLQKKRLSGFHYLYPYNPDDEWDRKMMGRDSARVDSVNIRWGVYAKPGGLDIREVQRLYLIDLRRKNPHIYRLPAGAIRITR